MLEIVAVLDRSGSMVGKENDVIGGFNSFLAEQQKLKSKAKLTLVLFDDIYEVVHDSVPLEKVEPLTSSVYYTRGCTALLDAVGKALSGRSKKGIAFVFTDGHENASCEYSKDKIKKLVAKREKKGWEVHFIGADIDSFHDAGQLGIRDVIDVPNNSAGIACASAYMASNSTRYRSTNG